MISCQETEESKNDIALVQLKSRLIFNRWVQPTCLPTQDQVSANGEWNWLNGPELSTPCVVVSVCHYVKSNSLGTFI